MARTNLANVIGSHSVSGKNFAARTLRERHENLLRLRVPKNQLSSILI